MDRESLNSYHEVYMFNQVFAVTKRGSVSQLSQFRLSTLAVPEQLSNGGGEKCGSLTGQVGYRFLSPVHH